MRDPTNSCIEMTLDMVDRLIGWATADAEHAMENDAVQQSADDRWRAKQLAKARVLIEQCIRE